MKQNDKRTAAAMVSEARLLVAVTGQSAGQWSVSQWVFGQRLS